MSLLFSVSNKQKCVGTVFKQVLVSSHLHWPESWHYTAVITIAINMTLGKSAVPLPKSGLEIQQQPLIWERLLFLGFPCVSGTNLKARSLPWLIHRGRFVKQYQFHFSLHCFFFQKQWTDYLKMKSCTSLYKQHNSQYNLQNFSLKPKMSPLTHAKVHSVPFFHSISLATHKGPPQWQIVFKIFSWWISRFIFFSCLHIFWNLTFTNCFVERVSLRFFATVGRFFCDTAKLKNRHKTDGFGEKCHAVLKGMMACCQIVKQSYHYMPFAQYCPLQRKFQPLWGII